MTPAKLGDKVAVHYIGSHLDGTVFDSSIEDDEPLVFVIGGEEVIPGFEQAMIGMQVGDTKEVLIPAAQAYGPRDPELLLELERAEFPATFPMQVGQPLRLRQDDGETMDVVITEITDTLVRVDGNHSLAGQDLRFRLTLEAIQ